jgi:hypothetical protein
VGTGPMSVAALLGVAIAVFIITFLAWPSHAHESESESEHATTELPSPSTAASDPYRRYAESGETLTTCRRCSQENRVLQLLHKAGAVWPMHGKPHVDCSVCDSERGR